MDGRDPRGPDVQEGRMRGEGRQCPALVPLAAETSSGKGIGFWPRLHLTHDCAQLNCRALVLVLPQDSH